MGVAPAEELQVIGSEDKMLNKCGYTSNTTVCIQKLGIVSKKKEHFGKDTAPEVMDEVCGLEQKNMINWAADVFQSCYSKKTIFKGYVLIIRL